MIGIYQDEFKDYLENNLGGPIKITHKNIVTRCPWCEMGVEKKHYHLWISIEAPIFRCFHAGCEGGSGYLGKLIRKISGKDTIDKYVDKDKIKETKKLSLGSKKVIVEKEFILPPVEQDRFKEKTHYIMHRMKHENRPISTLKGVVFDIEQFMEKNKVELSDKHQNLLPYLQTNFVGFITEHHGTMIFRNIDPLATFGHFKLSLQKTNFLDYLKLTGYNPHSNTIVLAEGIFDILAEHIFDSIGIRSKARVYAAALSDSYQALIKSLAFYEQVFRFDVHILSDRDVELRYYKKLKKFNSHLIDKLTIYYNRRGKDFNDTPAIPEKFVIT